jgi:hypothetical protein
MWVVEVEGYSVVVLIVETVIVLSLDMLRCDYESVIRVAKLKRKGVGV